MTRRGMLTALAMLLERNEPAWKNRYERPRFALHDDSEAVEEPAVEITYLANEGFLLAAGDDKVLIDALFPGIDGYPRVPPDLRSRLDRAEAPFDGVDLVLATHLHDDHFGPREVARHLASSGAMFVSTPDAVERLRRVSEPTVDIVAQHPGRGRRSRLSVGDDLAITVLNLHHGSRDIQNLGFIVEIGGLKVLHVGDTEVKVADIAPLELGADAVDVALLPGWILAEPSWRPLVAEIGARHLVVMHLASPDAPASWFGSAGSLEGRVRLIREHFPDAWIPLEPLAARRYAP